MAKKVTMFGMKWNTASAKLPLNAKTPAGPSG